MLSLFKKTKATGIIIVLKRKINIFNQDLQKY